MNEYQRELMGRPAIEAPWCPFCGRPWSSRHHIVPRSQGGAKGPTVTVCGMGNESGCHGLLHHHRLHLRWKGGWEWLMTDRAVKYEAALAMEGWQRLWDGS
ncbi:MAG: HNH endonuclease [Eggerthellaceae bacterium]|nr:HNH endonuclease [Eggerthellaceae bacterium]